MEKFPLSVNMHTTDLDASHYKSPGQWHNAGVTLLYNIEEPLRIPLVYVLTPGGSSGNPQGIQYSVTPA